MTAKPSGSPLTRLLKSPVGLLAVLVPSGIILSSLLSSSASAMPAPQVGFMPGKVRVGVWVRAADLAAPTKTVDKLERAGATVANIMINDFAGARGPTKFRTYSVDKIAVLAEECRKRGMAVDLTTWVMPHEKFIAGMAEQLPELLERCRARRLWLDAEEPWNQARDPLERSEAAKMIADAIPAEYDTGLTAISFANTEKIKPLARICGYWSPQAYSTNKASSPKPESVVSDAIARWTEKFGKPRRGWVMGLAAIGQPRPAPPSMSPPIAQVIEAGISEVCYWSSTAITRSDITAFVKSIART